MSESENVRNDCVTTIKKTHQLLRDKLGLKGNFDEIWENHLKDSVGLNNYANAMKTLANGFWDVDGSGTDRTKWCAETALQYFYGNGLTKCIEKDARREKYYKEDTTAFHCGPSPYENATVPSDENICDPDIKPLSLLDVGSCFNPFKTYIEFSTTAIDLCPSNKDVYIGDFLSIDIVKLKAKELIKWKELHNVTESDFDVPPTKKTKILTVECKALQFIPSNYFDIVVFSLLLTYIPCPHARWNLCTRAHKVLKTHGLLLIITPDSCHQNKHASRMKQWKMAIEGIGFQRVKYLKSLHLHHMAFRKVPHNFLWDKRQFVADNGGGGASKCLPIQQDLDKG